MASHYHIHIRGDPGPSPREIGALVLTWEAAQHECAVETSSKEAPKREAHPHACSEPCFGTRK